MTPEGRDKIALHNAVRTAEGKVRAATAARAEADTAQSGERVKLSAAGWRPGLLRLAGHGPELVEVLRQELREHSHLFVNTLSYMHDAAELIRHHFWWAPGESAPMTPSADRRAAEVELSRVGCNVFTALTLALDDLETRAPEAFGPADSLAKYEADRRRIVEQAEEAMATLAGLPEVMLLGLAAVRGLALEPRGNIHLRIVEHDRMTPKPARPALAAVR
jgi:hypothetical protein